MENFLKINTYNDVKYITANTNVFNDAEYTEGIYLMRNQVIKYLIGNYKKESEVAIYKSVNTLYRMATEQNVSFFELLHYALDAAHDGNFEYQDNMELRYAKIEKVFNVKNFSELEYMLSHFNTLDLSTMVEIESKIDELKNKTYLKVIQ